jgi:hypothetical protein
MYSNGITGVRTFKLPGGIAPDGGCFIEPRVALVKWYSSFTDKLYQVYVNGKYAGATLDARQRQTVVSLPASFSTAIKIEVFAVEPEDAHKDFSYELDDSKPYSGAVVIKLLRCQSLPLGSIIQIYSDRGSGEIDYENPINAEPIRVWPSVFEKSGFGTSRFGEGDFGYDSAAAIGFGRGDFGCGEFGLDADAIEWISETLPAGSYKFAAKVFDSAGRQSVATETQPFVVIPPPKPAEDLNVSSFDKQTNTLILSVE